jgi:N-acetylmuramoyl-L-alanine amidase
MKLIELYNDVIYKWILVLGIAFLGLYVPCNMAYNNSINIRAMQTQYDMLKREKHFVEEKLNSTHSEMESLQKVAAQKIAYMQNIKCLADNIYFEAGAEPIEGKYAVGQVTLNRLHERDRPKTVCGIVYEPYQFSWTTHKSHPRNSKTYQEAFKIATRMFTKKEKSSIIGSDVYFFHANYVQPSWADEKEAVATIGNHIFYK